MDILSQLFGYVLKFIYDIFNNYGVAIIIFSVILRLIILPITIKQQKTMRKTAKLQGKLNDIKRKYRNNPEKLNQETMALYKIENMSPFSGCLSSILQIVIILSVFWLVSAPLTYMQKIDKEIINNYTNEIKQENNQGNSTYPEIRIIEQKGAQDERVRINMGFLGIDLSKVPTQSLNDWRVYIIPVLYVITSFISIRMTTKLQRQTTKNKKDEIIVIENEEIKKEEPDELDSMNQMSSTMSYIAPIMSISIAIIAPLGLALYWLVSNLLMIAERLIIDKFISSKEEKEDVK